MRWLKLRSDHGQKRAEDSQPVVQKKTSVLSNDPYLVDIVRMLEELRKEKKN